MRIGAFEMDCVFQNYFTLAEVQSGNARLLRAFHVQNVRGTAADRLKIHGEINGCRIRQKAITNLAVGDQERARILEASVLQELTVPSGLMPGCYISELHVEGKTASVEVPFSFEILPAQVIPTDFARAELLSAYLCSNDTLRGFCADALKDLPPESAPEEILSGLFEALCRRGLRYQPVTASRYPDCQNISSMDYVLEKGGSCADLSLLLASLLWTYGLRPALLLFQDHLAVGCFADKNAGSAAAENSASILEKVTQGKLVLVEPTAVCVYMQDTFAGAKDRITQRLSHGEPCVLVDVTKALRSGKVRPITEKISEAIRCPHCGFDRFTGPAADTMKCPSCGKDFSLKRSTDVPSAAHNSPDFAPTLYHPSVKYIAVQQGAAVSGMADEEISTIRVAPAWRGKTVRSVASRAFAHQKMESLMLPDSVTEMGDYACLGCENLKQILLPSDIEKIGSGAFCGSGLKDIHIPGGVRMISRMTFASCASLENVSLEEGLEVIDERAFSGCPSLKRVQIPASVRRIAANAFDPGCELLLLSTKTMIR